MMFEPPSLEYKPPLKKRKFSQYSGIAQFVSQFAERDDPHYTLPANKSETRAERRARIHQLRLEAGAARAAEGFENYHPRNNPHATEYKYNTLFVAKLTDAARIREEFEVYWPIKQVRLVRDNDNQSRGYAFVEFMHTRDMKAAYKQANGKKIDNRPVLVDAERGRCIPNWRPRRLRGGRGTTRGASEAVTL